MASFVSRILDFVGLEDRGEEYADPHTQERYDQDSYYDERPYERSDRNSDRGYDRDRERFDRDADRGYDRNADRYSTRRERYAEPELQERPRRSSKGGKVVNHPSAMEDTKHYTRIYNIESYDDTRTVVDDLLADRSVLINLEMVDVEVSQRIVDMLAGATYALGASLKKVAANSYLLAPQSVDVSGSYDEDDRRRTGSLFGNRR